MVRAPSEYIALADDGPPPALDSLVTMTTSSLHHPQTDGSTSTNKKRRLCQLSVNDLVYVATKNMALPKGHARKLAPKFIGPYKILADYGNNSFKLELPDRLKQRGIHPVFHASLLRIHVPNDDRLFPGRLDHQVINFEEDEPNWTADKIIGHSGQGAETMLQVRWATGDETWLPYYQIHHLQSVSDYLDLHDMKRINDLPSGAARPSAEDPQLFNGSCTTGNSTPLHNLPRRLNMPVHQSQPSANHRAASDQTPLPNFRQHGPDHLLLVDATLSSTPVKIARSLLEECLAYSTQLRSMMDERDRDPLPLGYDLVARAVNKNNITYGLAERDRDGAGITTQHKQTSIALFFGNRPSSRDELEANLRRMNESLSAERFRREDRWRHNQEERDYWDDGGWKELMVEGQRKQRIATRSASGLTKTRTLGEGVTR